MVRWCDLLKFSNPQRPILHESLLGIKRGRKAGGFTRSALPQEHRVVSLHYFRDVRNIHNTGLRPKLPFTLMPACVVAAVERSDMQDQTKRSPSSKRSARESGETRVCTTFQQTQF
jgi:hypothetical protein